ncbi:DoxX family protein [Mycobacteroides abscessus subsp. bolletii]|uniref:DoxX family protein n=1 Tax=Mycobacteroides abscessus TaxID=36809 RepID=UPI0019D2D052|nr:DoxX family protein [Mycobacteroides abscessus]MBN7300801.1 DoxX family protein [Mycobacteroides abscessus subsp. bolletii]
MSADEFALDGGILLIRLTLGLILAAHGFDKFFSAAGTAGVGQWFESIGMRHGVWQARLAAVTEICAGLGLAAGFLTPLSVAGIVALMFVAVWTVHRKNGLFATDAGWEYNAVLTLVAIAVVATGPGYFSLDWLVFGRAGLGWVGGWKAVLAAVSLGLLGGIGQLAMFYRPIGTNGPISGVQD